MIEKLLNLKVRFSLIIGIICLDILYYFGCSLKVIAITAIIEVFLTYFFSKLFSTPASLDLNVVTMCCMLVLSSGFLFFPIANHW